jgi:hypothetical protein
VRGAWWVVNREPGHRGARWGVDQDGVRSATVQCGAGAVRCGAGAVRTTKRASATQSDCESAESNLTTLDLFSLLADMSSSGKKKTRARSTA